MSLVGASLGLPENHHRTVWQQWEQALLACQRKWRCRMKRIVMAWATCVVLAFGASAVNAAEAPTSGAKSTVMAGMSGIRLPTTHKAVKAPEIVVAKRGRRVLRGVAIGAAIVGAAIIASEAARADRRRAHRHRRNCRKWLRRCERGNDRACWRYDNRC